MIKIIEYQQEENNPSNSQERELEYESWEKYVVDIQKFDGSRNMPYPSIPRCTLPELITIDDDKIILRFLHRVFNKWIIHEARRV